MTSALDKRVDHPAPERPRRTKRTPILSAIGLFVVAAIVAVVVLVQRPSAATPESNQLRVETATVTKGDLTERVRAQGTLAYSAPRDVGTSLPGVVTGFTASGTVVTAGGELFRVDNLPVILMHGDLPVWRTFSVDMTDGADVAQLERNLAALGFFDREPDEEFTWATADAVESWQKVLGLEQTGMIEVGRILFSPTDLRIQAPKAKVGDATSGAITSVTGGAKEITAYIDTAQQGIAPVGGIVTVVLPGGQETTGTITAAGAPVEREGSGGKALKIPLTIALDDSEAAASFDNVTVSILLVETRGTDLLLVPVTALLAQPDGGFAVEVVSGATTTLEGVELGAFADGFVAVTGGELAEGDVVVVAK